MKKKKKNKTNKGSAVGFPCWPLRVYYSYCYCCCWWCLLLLSCCCSSKHATTILVCRAFSLPSRQPNRHHHYHHHHYHHATILASSSLSLTRRHEQQQDTAETAESVVVVSTTTKNDTTTQPLLLLLNQKQQDACPLLTSILLQVSYDGSRFSGWSAGNFQVNPTNQNPPTTNPIAAARIISTTRSPRSSQRRRNRHLFHGAGSSSSSSSSSNIRSVQGVLQVALAKVYGNIAPHRVVVEGASRTDKGVHAVGMVAQVYALKEEDKMTMTTIQATSNNHNKDDCENTTASTTTNSTTTTVSTIPGKRLPHPCNDTDTTGFVPLPMAPDKLAFTLNRMLPADVRITAYARLPVIHKNNNDNNNDNSCLTSFHASQSATAKTYRYTVAAGPRADPTLARTCWYTGTASLDWNTTTNAVQETIQILTARAYSFQAFAGAPRGRDDKKRAATAARRTCRLYHIDIQQPPQAQQQQQDTHTCWGNSNTITTTYVISITGDRFLYKMMRFLVGTLVGVASGKITPQQVQLMLETGQRDGNTNNLVCAPAHGLVLEKVHYDKGNDLEWHLANS